ncbi:hypothetical protein [Nitriliruptor alkaliphilus]|uniref:hypothetical protein n=1 Tax=Nitriliruptor alkaliphilus TaxID=427918 RepID=UPI000697131E|nr:hypothetical protein [Nitriliruptor alkaliphilus]
MLEPTDLLVELSLEHRELTRASADLRRRGDHTADAVRAITIDLVEHELAHRLLVHPLLRRDERGRLLFTERREEQLLLADRLRHALATTQGDGARHVPEHVVEGLDQQLVAHADREEIVCFPHVRRVVDRDELARLGALRRPLGDAIRRRLDDDDTPVVDGSWATTSRRDLPALLDLDHDLIIELPDLATPEGAASA